MHIELAKKNSGDEATTRHIERRLLENRIILVSRPVDDRMAADVFGKLMVLQADDAKKGITVIINSPGGAIDAGFGIYDVLRLITCPVSCLCAGLCASAGVLIYVGANKGKRYATPNSRFLIHQPTAAAYGQVADVEITAKEIIKLRQRAAELIAREVGKKPEQILHDGKRDFWLEAEAAREYGLVDHVVESWSQIK